MQLVIGKAAIFDGSNISAHGRLNTVMTGHEVVYKLGIFAQVNAQHVMHDQYLASCVLACTDANRVTVG